jgi:hypothetical protein
VTSPPLVPALDDDPQASPSSKAMQAHGRGFMTNVA